VAYDRLINLENDLSQEIEAAFGFSGLGLIVIKDVPNLKEKRQKLLMLSSKFANLPEEIKAKTVHKESHYSFGWSHGKERLKKGYPDVHKGSFYNNPQYDVPTSDPATIQKAPEVCSPNIWPKDDLPELEPAFKDLGQQMVTIGTFLAQHCDKFIKSKFADNYKTGTFEKVIRESRTCKARLLHYFPIKTNEYREYDSWCGWHNDHSALTGLCPSMFSNISSEGEIPSSDPAAGLHVKSRKESVVQVKISPDCLAYQIGETAQVFSGGILRATPHAVRALKYPESLTMVRDTFAVFMQPNYDFVLEPPSGVDPSSVAVGQYKKGMDFGEFGKATIAGYYD